MAELTKTNTWWNRNKDTVLYIGGVILLIAGGFLIIKNSMNSSVEKTDNEYSGVTPRPLEVTAYNNAQCSEARPSIVNGGQPFLVSAHVRNLSESRRASPSRRELAKRRGIELEEHQTYVEEYKKNCA